MVEIIAELPVLDDQNWWTVNGIGSSFWSSGFFASKNLGSNRFCSAKPLLARILTLTARKELRTLGLQISVHPNHNRPKCLEGQLATSIFPCNRLVSLGVAAASLFVAQQIFGYSMQDASYWMIWVEWNYEQWTNFVPCKARSSTSALRNNTLPGFQPMNFLIRFPNIAIFIGREVSDMTVSLKWNLLFWWFDTNI